MNVKEFWDAVLQQDADKIRSFFHPDGWVNWHNTNEHFTVGEFIRANCEYPSAWDGGVEKVVTTQDQIITVTHVYSKDQTLSFHVTSFLQIEGDKIASVDEYWGDDGDAPQWRQDKQIGRKIRG